MATSLGISFLSGLHLTCFYLYLCFYFLYLANTCLNVYSFNMSGEISTPPGLERNIRIGRWYNHSVLSRVNFGCGTCDNPTQLRDLGNILCWHEYSCMARYFQVTAKS